MICAALAVPALADEISEWWTPSVNWSASLDAVPGDCSFDPANTPLSWIKSIQMTGQDLRTEDTTDATGRVVAVVLFSHGFNLPPEGMHFYRSQDDCMAYVARVKAARERERKALEDKYR
jgi:hypothetical protein